MPQIRPTAARIAPPQQQYSGLGAAGGSPQRSSQRRTQLGALVGGSRKAMYKRHLDQLASKSANLPAPPPTYDPNLQYRVALKCAVEIPGFGEWLRPAHDNIVSGEFANSIADQISGAEVVS